MSKKNRYYAYEPKGSNGYAIVLDREYWDHDADYDLCTCYGDGLKDARKIAAALNKVERLK